VPVGAVCNNNCLFCMESDREERRANNEAMSIERVRSALEQRAGAEEVCFTCGEPTTRADLPELATLARGIGFRRISVMTNGRRLSYAPYAASLARAGVNRFYVSIHGHTQALHEGLTRTPGSFAQTVAGLDAVARLAPSGVELHTSTVVTRRSVPHLREIHRFLRSHGARHVVFNALQVLGRADEHFDRLVPRYTEVTRAFLELLEGAGESPVWAFAVDMPACTTEPIPAFHRGFVEQHLHLNVEGVPSLVGYIDRRQLGAGRDLILVTREDVNAAGREKRAECARCVHDAACEGVWSGYVRRYGWEEMVPVEERSEG
jgi:cyclic pyranopterin phosphate synthase